MESGDWKNKHRRLATAAVFVLALGAILLRTPAPEILLSDADAGHQLAGAQQISFGLHPFADFHSTYGPLTFYASWLDQEIGGHTIAAELLFCALAYATAYTLLFRCARQLGGQTAALAFIAIAIVQFPRFYKYYIFLGASLVLTSVYFYVRRPRLASLAMVAIAAVIAGLYRPDQGAYAIVVSLLAIALVGRPMQRHLTAFVGLLLAAASPWLIFLIYRGRLENYLIDSSFGAAHHAAGMELPFPHFDFGQPVFSGVNLSTAAYFLWWSVPVVAACTLFLTWKGAEPVRRRLAIVTIVYAALSLLQSAHRSDHGHLIQAIAPCYALLAFIASTVAGRSIAIRVPALTAVAGAMMISLCADFVTHASGELNSHVVHDFGFYYAHKPQAFVSRLRENEPDLPYVKLAAFVDANVAPDRPILALPFMTMLYYLTHHPFAGGQMLMAPGYFSDEADQRELIEALAREGNPPIIEQEGGGGYDGMPSRLTRSYEPIFYQYVDDHYRKIAGPPLPAKTDALMAR
jgi:hypothetical protein